jgi:hypothetical protein
MMNKWLQRRQEKDDKTAIVMSKRLMGSVSVRFWRGYNPDTRIYRVWGQIEDYKPFLFLEVSLVKCGYSVRDGVRSLDTIIRGQYELGDE